MPRCRAASRAVIHSSRGGAPGMTFVPRGVGGTDLSFASTNSATLSASASISGDSAARFGFRSAAGAPVTISGWLGFAPAPSPESTDGDAAMGLSGDTETYITGKTHLLAG